MSDNHNRPTPETDAALAAAEAKIKEISKRATNVDGIIDAIIEGMEVLVAAAYRMERERDEARLQLDDAVATAMAAVGRANRAVDEASLSIRKAEQAIARADQAEAELAELRSLWACEEPERQRAVEEWRAATGCKDGTPSVGAMLAFFRRMAGKGNGA